MRVFVISRIFFANDDGDINVLAFLISSFLLLDNRGTIEKGIVEFY